MTKLKDGFLRQEQERKEQEQSRPAPPPAAAAPKRRRESSKRRGDSTYSIQNRTSEAPCIPQNAKETPISMPMPCTGQPPITENPVIPFTPAPIEPSWGPLKRYTIQCTEKTYHQAVAAARWLYVSGKAAYETLPGNLIQCRHAQPSRARSKSDSMLIAWEKDALIIAENAMVSGARNWRIP